MDSTRYSELIDLIGIIKDEHINLKEELDATKEQVALLSEALIKPAPDAGQEHWYNPV